MLLELTLISRVYLVIYLALSSKRNRRVIEGETDKITAVAKATKHSRASTGVTFNPNEFGFLSRRAGKILGTDDPGGSKGLLKWKGVMFAPNDEVDQGTEHDGEEAGRDTTDSVEDLEQGSEVGLSTSIPVIELRISIDYQQILRDPHFAIERSLRWSCREMQKFNLISDQRFVIRFVA